MRRVLFFILPTLMFADNLKSILEHAQRGNEMVRSYKFAKDSKAKEVESKNSDFYPKVDIGASYKNTSDATAFQIENIYSGYAKAEYEIYDGGYKESQLLKVSNEHKASRHDEDYAKKSLSMRIVEDFYEIKSLESYLKSKEDEKRSIDEQLKRVKQFFDAKLATQDDIDRLQASYDKSIYEIESTNFNMLTLKKALELKVGKEIKEFEGSNFIDMLSTKIEQNDDISSLRYKQEAIKSSADALEGAYYPKIKIEDTYVFNEYGSVAANHPAKIDHQNTLMLSLNMRIFDYGATDEARVALLLSSKAMDEQIAYKTKEQNMQRSVAMSKIKSIKLKIKSASSALDSANSAFKTINEKYNAGIVDFVVYLDALTSKTGAKALYERSLNDLEIAYASFYYYSGKKIEEFIK